MLKKTIFLLCIIVTDVYVSAKTRTWAEKQTLALKILSNKTKTRAENTQLTELYSNTILSVVGNSDCGFVVVSNRDEWQPILGYSETSFKEDEIPEGLQWWINAITESMSKFSNSYTASDLLNSTRSFEPEVAPLIASTWNQSNPYNYLCPTTAKGGKYPSGCVATALSQIMNYHRYPMHGKGSYSYVFRPDDATAQQLTANFEETYYDWDNMLDNYSKGYNDAQRDAVATLMSHCGISVQMAYTTSGSGAYAVEATNALRNYFRYNENVRLCYRDYYSTELWMQILYTELNNKRPVYYKGQSNSGGHAFIIDGYNSEGLVHVNWGWGGKNDGFYEIALLNPSGEMYSRYQGMITNICSPDVEIAYESQLASDGLSINLYGSATKRLSLSAKVYEVGAEKFKGTVAAILQNNDTTIVAKKQEEVELFPADLGFQQGVDIALRSIDITNIPDGSYRVFMGCKTDKDNKWQLVRTLEGKTNSCILEKTGSDFSFTEIADDIWTGISSVKTNTNYSNRIYNLQGRNMGTDPSILPKGIYIIDGKKVVKQH